MFNQDIKDRFIVAVERERLFGKDLAAQAFEASSVYEAEAGTDLNAMRKWDLLASVSGILEYVTKRSWPDETGMRDEVLSLLRTYGKWSIKQRIANCTDELISLEDPAAVRYRMRFVANPMNLKQYLDDLFPVSSEYGTVSDTYHCFFWMAFAGVDESNAMRLTAENVNLRKMSFVVDEKTYPIYAEGVPSIWNSVYCKQFMISHPNYSKVSMKNRVEGLSILRGFSEKNTVPAFGAATRLVLMKSKSDIAAPNLTYRNVKFSGIFYRTYMLEMAGVRIDYKEVARSAMERRRQTEREIDPGNLRHKVSEIKTAYGIWKSAFVKCK